MTTVKTEQVTCDLCGAHTEPKAGWYAPEQWAKLHIASKTRYFDSYDICPMCMPPVEGRKQDWADAGHPDEEQLMEEAEARGDPAREPSDARSGA